MGSVPGIPSGSGIQEQILPSGWVVGIALITSGHIDIEPLQCRSMPAGLFRSSRAVGGQSPILHNSVAPFRKTPLWAHTDQN